jgi:UDP-N-acetylglucosamine:LPS N-acetylglucosamine transferase
MLRLIEAFSGHEVFLITHDGKHTRALDSTYSVKTYRIRNLYVEHIGSVPWLLVNMIIISLKELLIYIEERPKLVISTGGEIAIPICYIAKIFGRKKIIFIECFGRPYEPSGTAKLIYPIADLFLVQWESLLKKFKKARYEGRVL